MPQLWIGHPEDLLFGWSLLSLCGMSELVTDVKMTGGLLRNPPVIFEKPVPGLLNKSHHNRHSPA